MVCALGAFFMGEICVIFKPWQPPGQLIEVIMEIFTQEIEKKLADNAAQPDESRRPVLKLFGGGACTWLISERIDDDTLFGLCDLGLGFPELGSVSQSELLGLRFQPLGLPIERDLYFKPEKTLGEYATQARESGFIDA
jgi:hypothetical protein